MRRIITENSYDIYYMSKDRQFVERDCISNLIDLFVDTCGEENIIINDVSNFPIVSGYGFGGRPDVVLVQHPLSRTWAVWDTNDMSGWLVSLIWGEGLDDYRFYVLPSQEFSPKTLVSAFTLSPRSEGGKICQAEPYFKCPYPGQDINRTMIDSLYFKNIKALPYTIFRGRSCSVGESNSRYLFIKHLSDIIKSKQIKEVVIASEELDIYLNIDQLPPQSRRNNNVWGEDYLHEIASSSACISIPGFADVSRRDIETLGLGRCVIRPPYVCNLWGDCDTNPFLHTKQCIKPIESTTHRYGWEYLEEDLVRASCMEMVERSLEIISNTEMRNEMRKNARNWYESYCSPRNIANYLFNNMMNCFKKEHKKWEAFVKYNIRNGNI